MSIVERDTNLFTLTGRRPGGQGFPCATGGRDSFRMWHGHACVTVGSAIVESALHLHQLPLSEIITRRTKIVWLKVAGTHEVKWRKIVASGHSHFPVYEGPRDHIIGMVSV